MIQICAECATKNTKKGDSYEVEQIQLFLAIKGFHLMMRARLFLGILRFIYM